MIGWYVHHHGSGHLQRASTVARHLRTPVTGLSCLAKPADWPGDWVRLARDDEPEPAAAADPTAGGRLHWAPLRHAGYGDRMATIARWVADARPGLVVTDVSIEVAVLARTMGIPLVVMAMRGDRSDPAHALGYDLAQTLVAPWPEVFAEPGWPDAWKAKTVHTGAFSRFDELAGKGGTTGMTGTAGTVLPVERSSVTCLLGSGGADGMDDPREWTRRVRAATPDWTWTFCGGPFGPSDAPLQDVLSASSVVVTHAGQNSVAEVAALRRPAVVVAQRRPHDEQRATGRAIASAGLAVTCDGWPDPAGWPELLDRARDIGGAGWVRWNDHGGAGRAASALDEQAVQ